MAKMTIRNKWGQTPIFAAKSGLKQNRSQSPFICIGCGRRPVTHGSGLYCLYCHTLYQRMLKKRVPEKSRKKVFAYIRTHDFRCQMTGMPLELDNSESPWYVVLHHRIPHNASKILLTSALVNAMMSELTEKEFWFTIGQLARHHLKGTAVKKIRLAYWYKYLPKKYREIERMLTNKWGQTPIFAAKSGLKQNRSQSPFISPFISKKCSICGRPAYEKRSMYCLHCKMISWRMLEEHFPYKTRQTVWDYIRKFDYICHYSKIRLNLAKVKSPWYVVFDHWNPHDQRRIVLTCALFNEMKSDLTEEEFWYFVTALDRFKRKGVPVKKRKLKYWKRPYGR